MKFTQQVVPLLLVFDTCAGGVVFLTLSLLQLSLSTIFGSEDSDAVVNPFRVFKAFLKSGFSNLDTVSGKLGEINLLAKQPFLFMLLFSTLQKSSEKKNKDIQILYN